MKLYAFVLIGLAVLALSAICNAGKDSDKKKYRTNEEAQIGHWDETHNDDDRLKQPHDESSATKANSLDEFQEAIAALPRNNTRGEASNANQPHDNTSAGYWANTHRPDDRLIQPQQGSSATKSESSDSLNALQKALAEQAKRMPPTNAPKQQATTASVANSLQNPINLSDSEGSSRFYDRTDYSSDSSTKSRPKSRRKN